MNASASAVRSSEKAKVFVYYDWDWIGEVCDLDARNRKRVNTYMSIIVNMNQTIRYNPRAFDNSWVLLPYAAKIPDPGMKMAA